MVLYLQVEYVFVYLVFVFCFYQNHCKKANPQWRERFDFNQFPSGHNILEVEVWSKEGRKYEDCYGT